VGSDARKNVQKEDLRRWLVMRMPQSKNGSGWTSLSLILSSEWRSWLMACMKARLRRRYF